MSKKNNINRRDFLKLAATLPLLGFQNSRRLENFSHIDLDVAKKNVLFIVIDTLAAKNMSLYGYPRETTPNIAKFAEKAIVYHNHYSAGNFTSPGTASLLTGTYPWTHRAVHMHGTVLEDYRRRNFISLLPEDITKIAYTHNLLTYSLLHQFRCDIDRLYKPRDAALFDPQYSDLLFHSDYNASYASETVIMRERMASSLFHSLLYRIARLAKKRWVVAQYEQKYPKGIPNLNDIYYILELSTDWLIEQLRTVAKPFLIYYHPLPPHEPYFPRSDFVDKFKSDGFQPIQKPAHYFSDGHEQSVLNQQRREYDEYLAFVDLEFGRILDNLEENGRFDDTIIILTTDHGEMFERGIRGHVTPTLFEPLIKIPLLISEGGRTSRQDIYSPTSSVDILPTLLKIYDQTIPPWCEGEPLPPFGENIIVDRSVYAVEAKTNPKTAPLDTVSVAMIKNGYKLVHYLGYDGYDDMDELFHVDNDPDEMDDLFAYNPNISKELKEELLQRLDEANNPFR